MKKKMTKKKTTTIANTHTPYVDRDDGGGERGGDVDERDDRGVGDDVCGCESDDATGDVQFADVEWDCDCVEFCVCVSEW